MIRFAGFVFSVLAFAVPVALVPAAEAPATTLQSSPDSKTELGIAGSHFTLNGSPTFLLGISYYAGVGAPQDSIRRDLADMKRYGINWLRVFANWDALGHDVSAFDHDGTPREPYMTTLKWLVAECDREGMAVDVTLGRDRSRPMETYIHSAEAIVSALKPHRNWYLDLGNERNVGDQRFVSFEELQRLRERVKQLDPSRLVTASSGGDISKEELGQYLKTAQVDFICPHRPRDAESPAQTEAKTGEYLAWMKEIGRVLPVHYQEPFRRGYGQWQPRAADFIADLRAARAGGAAGWCFHNGSARANDGEKPGRSFDLHDKRLFEQLDPEELRALAGLRDALKN